MFNYRRSKNLLFFRFLTVFLLSVLIVFILSFFFADRIASLTLRHFTGYSLSYEKWGNSIFDRRDIFGLVLTSGDRSITVNADEANFEINIKESIMRKACIIECVLKGASLALKSEKLSNDNVLSVFLTPQYIYDKIRFAVSFENKKTTISGIDAESKDLRIRGNCGFLKDTDRVRLYLEIDVSPQLYANLPEGIRNRILTPGDKEWYGAVIDYKGPLMLFRFLLH